MLVVLTILVCSLFVRAGSFVYDYNGNCETAYRHYLSLHIEQGRATVIKEFKANPYNLFATYISDYEDYIVLLLNVDKKEYDQCKDHLDGRIALLEKGDKSSPWFRFCKAGIYMHWAMIHMRFGEQLKAALLFKKAFSLLNENEKLFPDFEYNSTFRGLQEAIVGALPDNYKWLASIFGLKGNINRGLDKLSNFSNSHTDKQPLVLETNIYYLYIKFYFTSKQSEVWTKLSSQQFETKDNMLNAIAKTYIAQDYRKSDEVIKLIREMETNKNYDRFPYLDYQMGMALLTCLDSGCVWYFKSFLTKNKGELHVKDAWQKLAYWSYISGDIVGANSCRETIKKEGNTLLDVDKQALRFAEGKTWQNKTLLQARMLLDGGYYTRAYNVLMTINRSELTNPADKSEYYFRLGRVYEESGECPKALSFFQDAIEIGKGRHEQFAARAALHCGKIYEQTGMKSKAIIKYKEVLKMPSHDFQNSIDQQAKTGLNRLGDN